MLNKIYKCAFCGNIVEVLHTKENQIICCGKPMELLVEKNKDEGMEKHVPVIEKTENGILVKVGSVPHPMEKSHYIEWIEVSFGEFSCKKFLKPGDKPEAEFAIQADDIQARAYCNVHGLWQN